MCLAVILSLPCDEFPKSAIRYKVVKKTKTNTGTYYNPLIKYCNSVPVGCGWDAHCSTGDCYYEHQKILYTDYGVPYDLGVHCFADLETAIEVHNSWKEWYKKNYNDDIAVVEVDARGFIAYGIERITLLSGLHFDPCLYSVDYKYVDVDVWSEVRIVREVYP